MLLVLTYLAVFTAADVLGVPAPGATTVPGVTPTEPFNKSDVLDSDNKYVLFWKFNDSHITFEVHVKTEGYVGFGISDKGGMFPGDVVVGWVKDGTIHFADRHTTARAAPILDKTQNWYLLYGEETGGQTILKFVRKLDTCDDTEDKVIKEGYVHVIYSYSDRDPANDSALFYHGPYTRGTKAIPLLAEYETPTNLPADVKRLEFLNRNYEPVITPGNEKNIHHLILYRCNRINASLDGVQGNCYASDRPLPSCFNMVVAWVVGGQPFYFPANVGLSIGAPNDASFYILETHYDNPSRESGMIDNSGIRITITKNLRTHDAGIFLMGHDITLQPLLPPHQKDFLVKGYCPADCFNRGIRTTTSSEIKIFAALQHSHLLGKAIKTRHFRNGTELPPIMDEPHYDFNFQELVMLPKERVVKPGDSISVECTYDTTGKSSVVLSGWGTDEEMCNTFLYYYPWMESQFCLSRSLYDSFSFHGQKLMPYLQGLDWTDPAVVTQYQQQLQNSTVEHQCFGAAVGSASQVDFVERDPLFPYTPPAKSCDGQVNPIIIG